MYSLDIWPHTSLLIFSFLSLIVLCVFPAASHHRATPEQIWSLTSVETLTVTVVDLGVTPLIPVPAGSTAMYPAVLVRFMFVHRKCICFVSSGPWMYYRCAWPLLSVSVKFTAHPHISRPWLLESRKLKIEWSVLFVWACCFLYWKWLCKYPVLLPLDR